MKRNSNIELNTVYFWTATINNWLNLLETKRLKNIILESISYLTEKKKIKVYAFVIMPNHIHLVLENVALNGKEKPTTSLLKYTAHQFKNFLLKEKPSTLKRYASNKPNKQYEFWQRDSLAIEIYDIDMAWQKIDYIHNNPLSKKWSLCEYPEEYMYSSANFYLKNNLNFDFLHHIQDAL